MKKVNEIFENEKYRKYLKELEILEKDRVFCKHDLEHFLNFSRIAYIRVLEEKINVSKEVIYGVGLLHDIGRVLEYKEGIDHNIGSIMLSKEILEETTYTEEEKNLIYKCIDSHRKENDDDLLFKIIYESDKLSRECYKCMAEKECYWKKEKKNMNLKY
ncbi:MAG: HD domain-containing protein [Clostridium sp.]|uniref:HD domain-containing protein n=1 Tax=Clostridium sp. TaxID=1506 RepID=UPI003EE80BCB